MFLGFKRFLDREWRKLESFDKLRSWWCVFFVLYVEMIGWDIKVGRDFVIRRIGKYKVFVFEIW